LRYLTGDYTPLGDAKAAKGITYSAAHTARRKFFTTTLPGQKKIGIVPGVCDAFAKIR
jgi:xanthine dehydrogenase iron-sulfur cluster and FAD-binding subunit A